MVIAVCAGDLHAARYPYQAEVAREPTVVRSGPGRSFYPTTELQPRDRVEVYYETDDGWAAIRPPQGSYSWVDARRLKVAASGKVAQVELESSSFIGSELSEDRDAVAVRLKQGERVAIVGVDRAAKNPWVMIAPPAGEFRWIELKALRAPRDEQEPARLPATDIAASNEMKGGDNERIPPPLRAANHNDDRDGVARPATRREPALLPAAAIEEATELEIESTEVQPVDHESDVNAEPRVARANLRKAPRAVGRRTTTAQLPSASNAARPKASDFWQQRVALELELSSMASRDPRTWRFDDIRRDAQSLYDQARDGDEQDAARHLLGKIAQFESARRERLDLDERIAKVKRSLDAAATASANRPSVVRRGNAAASAPAAANVAAAGPVANHAAGANSRYDASGRLVAVQSKRPGTPPFAIVDDRNQVKTFISPAPNVNLQPYTGRVVGITGVTSPQVTPGREHVVAQRIAVLEGPIRR